MVAIRAENPQNKSQHFVLEKSLRGILGDISEGILGDISGKKKKTLHFSIFDADAV